MLLASIDHEMEIIIDDHTLADRACTTQLVQSVIKVSTATQFGTHL